MHRASSSSHHRPAPAGSGDPDPLAARPRRRHRRIALLIAAGLTAAACTTAAVGPVDAASAAAPAAPAAPAAAASARADASPAGEDAGSTTMRIPPGVPRSAWELAEDKGIAGWNSHGPWLDISYAMQKVIIAVGSATATLQICRIAGPEGAALCAFGAIFFTGVFELLKAHRICPPGQSFRLYYFSHHPSYCH
jgi:hypothetical protein